MKLLRLFVLSVLCMVPFASASGQDRDVPYWATIRATELNMRVGPSAEYRIDWVYHRQGLPVKVVRVLEGWRLIEDPDGTRGWVVARLLSPERGAIIIGDDLAEMRADSRADAPLKWRVEPGVSGELGPCKNDWCQFATGKRRGWIRARQLWGAGSP